MLFLIAGLLKARVGCRWVRTPEKNAFVHFSWFDVSIFIDDSYSSSGVPLAFQSISAFGVPGSHHEIGRNIVWFIVDCALQFRHRAVALPKNVIGACKVLAGEGKVRINRKKLDIIFKNGFMDAEIGVVIARN